MAMGSDPPWAKEHDPEQGTGDEVAEKPTAVPDDPDRAGALPEANSPTAKPRAKKKSKKRSSRTQRERMEYIGAATKSLIEGEDPAVVDKWLRKKGLGEKEIAETLEVARSQAEEAPPSEAPVEDLDRSEAARRRQKDIVAGALWFTGGLLLTVLSYSSAHDSGGGRYVLALGPVAYGIFRLVRGLPTT